MARYCFYIDGFNMYYALNSSYRQCKWLNYRALAERVIGNKDSIAGIYYFTAFTHWKKDNVERHKVYIKALRGAGVETIKGHFKEKTIKCHNCQKPFTSHEEKRTDVNIALKIFTDAMEDIYDRAVIISADSDLIPAVESVHKYFPNKEIGVMFPIGRERHSFDLKQATDFRIKMKLDHLHSCQFSNEIKLDDGEVIKKPECWL